MKLFQNLYTGLAEVVKSLFLFIALAAILFNVAELFEQFWYRVTQETFLYNYFKIHPLVQEKLFKGFFLFLALAAILFNRREGFEQILVDSHLRNIPVKLFQNLFIDLAEEVVKSFLSIYSPGGHFVLRSRIVLAILVEGHPRNIPV